MEFNFDSLDPTQFEEFCYDLLLTLSPAQIDWRKGTPLSSSPSDQGRDIEATFMKTEIDGSQHPEKWHIECKHYEKGVPPDKLQGAISWAMSARPDVLLIIASGYLSNQCKTYLTDYKENNKPPFKIHIWERKNLDTLSSGNMQLRSKYGLTKELPYMKLINNYHAAYSLKSNYNSLPFFLAALEELDGQLRTEVFYETFFETIKPRFREPVNDQESPNDCMLDKVDYYSYKKKLLNSGPISSRYVVSTVTLALASFFTGSDITVIKNVQANWDAFIQHATSLKDEQELTFFKEKRDSIEREVNYRYERYNHFCNTFVKKLLSETRAI